MMHKLEADSILLEFGTRRILSDIFIRCETGKITGILGRNGQGKTCLMNIIYGSLNATDKSIRFDHVSIFYAYKHAERLKFLPQFNFIPKSFSLKRVLNDFNLDQNEFIHHFPMF
jgi:ABC-type multidrug transport system ATPase subunit